MASEAATAGTATMSAGDVGSGELGESASESTDHGEEDVNAVCGDGLVEGDEACDDGNLDDDDGCDHDCQPSGTRALALGWAHSCALARSGQLRCWGRNDDGQLGLGHNRPIGGEAGHSLVDMALVDYGGRVSLVRAAGNVTCALGETGQLKCWGRNVNGQLGLEHTDNFGDDAHELPASLAGFEFASKVKDFSVSPDHVCAMFDDGGLVCWGLGGNGELGYGHTETLGDEPGESPVELPRVTTGEAVSLVHTSSRRTCVVLGTVPARGPAAGRLPPARLSCWGRNGYGDLGHGHRDPLGDEAHETPDQLPTVQIAGLPRLVVGDVGGLCVKNGAGELRCWGSNAFGRLGQAWGTEVAAFGDDAGEVPDRLPAIELGGTVATAACGEQHCCAILGHGGLRCWGGNGDGQLGLGHAEAIGDDEVPSAAAELDIEADLTSIALGQHSCVLSAEGRVWCWGNNQFGQLGLGHTRAVGSTPDATPGVVGPLRLP